ncbi:molybdenum cofactor guanylyltransferase [Bacillota bacterium LX-D]|nr:molybdenum cofactor guanylyltransferase [Bacillota bacterium LX-D]
MRGIILAGGKSSRMNCNKSFVKLDGKPFIEIIVDKVRPIFKDKITIITNEPELYRYLNTDICCDLVKDKGPIAGIYTGLVTSDSFHNFFLPCDMPFISGETIKYMLKHKGRYDVIVPLINGYIEPLYGIYSKNCIKAIEKCLLQNLLKVKSLYEYVSVKTIPEEVFTKLDSELKLFTNINTLQELMAAQQIINIRCQKII